MRKKTLSLALLMALSFSSLAQAESVFGERPKLKGLVKISTLLEHPKDYLGKEIKIEGIAMDVCPKRGCWMKIKSDRKKESLLIKVNDGEMVFPMSARGKNTVLQGRLVQSSMPEHEVIELEKARAEKAGKKFDPASVKGPRISYKFIPSGVIIQD